MPSRKRLPLDNHEENNRPEILIVDDEPLLRKMLQGSLSHFGFIVRIAASAAEALALFEQHHATIALVLLDVQMPGLDGPQTLAALRRIAPQVRFCFMSGHTGQYTARHLLDMGAAAVFEKPFEIAELARQLRLLIAPD
jgi:DNA-binding response OmpR family regulator